MHPSQWQTQHPKRQSIATGYIEEAVLKCMPAHTAWTAPNSTKESLELTGVCPVGGHPPHFEVGTAVEQNSIGRNVAGTRAQHLPQACGEAIALKHAIEGVLRSVQVDQQMQQPVSQSLAISRFPESHRAGSSGGKSLGPLDSLFSMLVCTERTASEE